MSDPELILEILQSGELQMTESEFTAGQEAIMERVAYRAAQKVIETHVDGCPHGKRLQGLLDRGWGLAIGAGLASGAGGFFGASAAMRIFGG